MTCSLEKGHEGPCVVGDAGTCKKTAAKWFTMDSAPTRTPFEAPDDDPEEFLSEEEMATADEAVLAAAYRRTHVPSTRREAVEWARDYIEERDA